MKKVLFVATVVKGHIMAFHVPYLKWFKENGYEVHVCAKNDYEKKENCIIPYCDSYFDLSFSRSPISIDNIIAYRKIKRIIYDQQYEIIHCHTPIGGFLGRIAARKVRRQGTKVIYTAHGFHFYRGCSIKNWIMYYPVEKILGNITDYLITIVKEDYEIAVKKHLCKKINHIHGIGANTNKFRALTTQEKSELRKLHEYAEDDFLCICIGELNNNKNQIAIIRQIPILLKTIPNIKLLLAGDGVNAVRYKNEAERLGVSKQVIMLGHRDNLENYVGVCDVLISASYREGLPLSVVEGMLSGLPVVISNIRGNRELIMDGKEGFLFDPSNGIKLVESINQLYITPLLEKSMGSAAAVKAKLYSDKSACIEMYKIYEKVISDNQSVLNNGKHRETMFNQ